MVTRLSVILNGVDWIIKATVRSWWTYALYWVPFYVSLLLIYYIHSYIQTEKTSRTPLGWSWLGQNNGIAVTKFKDAKLFRQCFHCSHGLWCRVASCPVPGQSIGHIAVLSVIIWPQLHCSSAPGRPCYLSLIVHSISLFLSLHVSPRAFRALLHYVLISDSAVTRRIEINSPFL